jgi:hypothetical protein
MAFKGMMLCSATGLLLASFAAPSNAAPALASVDGVNSSRAPIIDNVRYVCWWKHGIYRKCEWVGPGYYRRYGYYGYDRPYRRYYDGEGYYRRW